MAGRMTGRVSEISVADERSEGSSVVLSGAVPETKIFYKREESEEGVAPGRSSVYGKRSEVTTSDGTESEFYCS